MKNNIKSAKGFTLVEMLGVLAIIAILISVIAVGVMAAINRAQIVATVANFKNLETATIGFVAMNTSGGTVPITQGPAAPNTADAIATFDPTNPGDPIAYGADDNSYTLDQVLRAAGLIDQKMTWRVGSDAGAQLAAVGEQHFIVSRNAFDVNAPANPNDWANFNHSAASVVEQGACVAGTGPIAGFGTTNGVNFWLNGGTAVGDDLQNARCAYVALFNVSIKHAQAISREVNTGVDDSEFQDFQSRGRFIYAAPNPGENTVTCYYYLASF